MLHRMMLIGHTHSSQFMEWQNLCITTLKHATCVPNVFKKLPENQITADFFYLTSSDFVITSQINYWDQVNSWKNLWKFWNGSLCRNKSSPFSLLNVAAYWQSSNAEACAKKFSQILANNFNNGGGGLVSEFMWGIVAKGTAIKIRAYLSTILVIIFWNFSIFYPSSDLP